MRDEYHFSWYGGYCGALVGVSEYEWGGCPHSFSGRDFIEGSPVLHYESHASHTCRATPGCSSAFIDLIFLCTPSSRERKSAEPGVEGFGDATAGCRRR